MKSELYEWRPVVGYEGLYEVNNLGEVRSLGKGGINQFQNKEVILKPCKQSNGYLTVSLYKDRKPKTIHIHRLVACAFIPNPDTLPCINHIDENKENNYVSNLEWCTWEYNYSYGTRIERGAKSNINNPLFSKPVFQFDKDNNFLKEWPSAAEIERELGFLRSSIGSYCRGTYNGRYAYGYIWKYSM